MSVEDDEDEDDVEDFSEDFGLSGVVDDLSEVFLSEDDASEEVDADAVDLLSDRLSVR